MAGCTSDSLASCYDKTRTSILCRIIYCINVLQYLWLYYIANESEKCQRLYDNKYQEVEEETSKKLAGKGQNSKNNRVNKKAVL